MYRYLFAKLPDRPIILIRASAGRLPFACRMTGPHPALPLSALRLIIWAAPTGSMISGSRLQAAPGGNGRREAGGRRAKERFPLALFLLKTLSLLFSAYQAWAW